MGENRIRIHFFDVRQLFNHLPQGVVGVIERSARMGAAAERNIAQASVRAPETGAALEIL